MSVQRAVVSHEPTIGGAHAAAEGRLIHLGRSMGTADGRLVGHDGTLYAHASTTCFILDTAPPR